MKDPGQQDQKPTEQQPVVKNRLYELVMKAADEMASYEGTISIYAPYKSFAQFSEALKAMAKKLRNGNKRVIGEINTVFLPTGDWDEAEGSPGLANSILAEIKRIRK